jgi:galactonate dehydratase
MLQKTLYAFEGPAPSRRTRRDFLKVLGGGAAASTLRAAVENTEPMKIIRIDAVTFRKDIHIGGGSGGSDAAEFWWVLLHTDKGLVGTGETYPFSNSEVGVLKDQARNLIGRDPRDIDGIWRNLYFNAAMRNAGGAEMCTLSAINVAQLDILGQAVDRRDPAGVRRPALSLRSTP